MAPAITIAMATGANLRRARATVTMMHGRSDVVLAAIAKNQIKTGGTATAILAWLTAIATIENAIARSRMHSPDMFTCLADQSASSFTTAIATTPCAAPNPGRSRPLVHSGWSPVVISALRHAQGAPSLSRGETTMGVRLIRGLVTRPVSPRGDVERLMLLDAVLAVGDVEWLTAAAEKAAYLEGLKAKATDDRPQEPTSDEVRPGLRRSHLQSRSRWPPMAAHCCCTWRVSRPRRRSGPSFRPTPSC